MDLLIRHVEPNDFEAVREIYAGPKAVAGTLQVPFPSAEMWRKRLSEQPPDARMLVAIADRKIVGHLGMRQAHRPRRSHAAAIGMAVHDEWHGRGIGSALLRDAVALADNWLNVWRFELTVYTDNAAAVHLYQKFSFVIEGTHRGYALRDGTFVDAYAMARLNPNAPGYDRCALDPVS